MEKVGVEVKKLLEESEKAARKVSAATTTKKTAEAAEAASKAATEIEEAAEKAKVVLEEMKNELKKANDTLEFVSLEATESGLKRVEEASQHMEKAEAEFNAAIAASLESVKRRMEAETIAANTLTETHLDVAMDCRWSSRGFNAEEATVTCCCPATGKVLFHAHLMREQKSKPLTKRDYVGSSKGMEGEGVSRVCKMVMDAGYVIRSMSHDNDASSMAQVTAVFPDVIEMLDVGHASKNVCKKVKLLGKEFKELGGFGEKVKRRFQTLAYGAKGDVSYFVLGLDRSVKHWCGDHLDCDHGALNNRAYQPLDPNGLGVAALVDLFSSLKDQVKKFVSGSSSNICEAVNNEITGYAAKKYNFFYSYDIRANLAILVHNEGPKIKLEILRRLGLSIPQRTHTTIMRREERREYQKRYKKNTDKKSQRAKKKEEKKKRGAKVVDPTHQYGGTNTPDEELDGNSLLREPRAKKQRTEAQKCGCKADESCKKGSCGCVAFNKACNSKCKCGDKCRNKYNNK